jgi:hypothetical protein
MKKHILSFLYILISVSLFSQDFEVAPVIVDFTADPGETETKIITIQNHGNKKLSIVLGIEDYLIDTKGNRSFLPANSTKNSIANSISFSPSLLEINPNESKEVAVTVQAPADDYSTKWGIIYVTSAAEQNAFTADKTVQAGIGISARISVQVSHSPKSNKNYNVKITNLREITKEGNAERDFQANIENIGEKITNCKVYLVASNIKTAEEFTFNSLNITVYPKSSRIVELKLPQGSLKNGQYSLAAILDYGSSSALEGTQIMIEVK